MSLQTDVIGPVFSKIWDTPGSGYSDRMKHVIEPTFSAVYLTDIANQSRVPLTDSSIVVVGDAMSLTYGLTNRLIVRTRSTDGARGSTREFLTVGVQQTYYTNPETSRYDTTYVSYSGRPRPVDLSPIAALVRFAPTQTIDANARLEYDVTGNGLQVLSAGSTVSTAASSSNVNFSRQRFTPLSDLSSYVSGSSAWRFSQGRITAFYGLNWDIDAKYIYSQSIGGTYMSQCCGVRGDFQVVNFRNKQDLVPGLQTMLWFTPTEVGKYEIGCAQLCGIGHTQMIGNVFVDTPEAYDAWAKEQLQGRVATSAGGSVTPAQAVETSDARGIAGTAPKS